MAMPNRKVSFKLLIGSAFAALLLLVVPAFAQETSRNAALIQFMAGQGCAIGPTTKRAARAAGFTAQEIDHLSVTARADPETIETGEWFVLSADICEIEMPNIDSRVRLSDPEVVNNFSAVDAYAAEGDPGCYFSGGSIIENLARTRGWGENTANREYLNLLGAALISRELSFYS